MRLLVATLLLAFGVAGCASVKVLEATGGSRSDGTVELSYEYGSLEAPQVQYEQGLVTARERCAAWGYSDAEAFGGQKETCQLPGTYRCLRFFVTVTYQCISASDLKAQGGGKASMAADARAPQAAALPPMPAQHVETERPQRNSAPDPAELYRRSDPSAYRWIKN
jgi:hypothetical protein